MKRATTSLYLCLTLLFTNQVIPNGEPRYPKNPSFAENVADFLHFEELGVTEVSGTTKKFILDIMQELQIKGNIRIRRANPSFMKQNACIMPCGYFFIDEDWFNRLSEGEKRALIGHELMHYKHNHVYKKLLILGPVIFSLAIKSVLSGVTMLETNLNRMDPTTKNEVSIFLKKRNIGETTTENPFGEIKLIKDETKSVINKGIWASLVVFPVLAAFQSRHLEKNADVLSAKQLKCAKDSVKLMKTLKKENEDPESRFRIKRFINSRFNPIFQFLYGTHPTQDTRIAYLEKLSK